MAEDDYAAAIDTAFDVTDPRESIARVKDVVGRAILRSDGTATLHRTSFYNHTYSPDFVIEWPRDPGLSPRNVFHRSSQSPTVILDDLRTIGPTHPIVLQLDQILYAPGSSEVRQREELRNQSRIADAASEAQALVVEVGSLQSFADTRPDSSGARLYSSSVIRGGRGRITPEVAAGQAETVAEGFDGASENDPRATRAAVDVITETLDRNQASRISGVMQAVWVGAGGSATTFPSVIADLSGRLDPATLHFVLNFGDLGNGELWQRLAGGIDLDLLMSLESVDDTRGFQQMMDAVVSRLRARACVVRGGRRRLDANDAEFRWSVNHGALILRGGDIEVLVGMKLGDLEAADPPESLPTVDTVRNRSIANGVPFREFEATNGDEALRYSTDDSSGALAGGDMDFVTTALGESARVRRAVVTLKSGDTCELNFATQSASTKTRARPAVVAFIKTCVPLLTAMDGTARAALLDALEMTDA